MSKEKEVRKYMGLDPRDKDFDRKLFEWGERNGKNHPGIKKKKNGDIVIDESDYIKSKK